MTKILFCQDTSCYNNYHYNCTLKKTGIDAKGQCLNYLPTIIAGEVSREIMDSINQNTKEVDQENADNVKQVVGFSHE